MNVEQLAPGLWRWSAVRDGYEVWCVYYEAPDATVLIDPVVPSERDAFFRALDRDVERRAVPVVILCTGADGDADVSELAERYGATILRA